jgi:hypothetical protein
MNSLKKIALMLTLTLSVAHAGPTATTFSQVKNEFSNLINAKRTTVLHEDFKSFIHLYWQLSAHTKRSVFDNELNSNWQKLYKHIYKLLNQANNGTLSNENLCVNSNVSTASKANFKPGWGAKKKVKAQYAEFLRLDAVLKTHCKS